MRIPRSTYRLQLTADFTLWDAARLVPYLQRLGVDWVYLSPILQSTEGSTHGYDVTDHSRIDVARGGAEGLAALSEAAHDAGLGVLVDIVPNHVGVAEPAQNPWWWNLLKHGTASRYAEAFDVDWDFGAGKVRLPVLGDDSLEALQVLRPDGSVGPGHEAGEPVLAYYEHLFPIAPGTADDGATPQIVHGRQNYELMNWRRESDELNYRRFFAVSSLAAVRVEETWVFDESHAEIGRWFREGLVDGLRVDHPDGLADPGGYLERLEELTGGAYVLVEKILEGGEALQPDWRTAGTTGYDALAIIDRLFVDPDGEAGLDRIDAQLREESGLPTTGYREMIHETKRAVADGILRSEVRRIVREIERSESTPPGASTSALDDAVAELLTSFPVYRSYLPAGRDHLQLALQLAVRSRPDLEPLLTETAEVLGREGHPAATRFQQTSGMVMAKGVEDTAFYRYTRLTSLTEVGAEPDRFSVTPDDFHAEQVRRLEMLPHSMTTLSTHDTKRSEDVRARISALSELGDGWGGALTKLRSLQPTGDGPFDNLLWQALVGAWPLTRERAQAYAEKAAREAGDFTGWLDPDQGFEAGFHRAIDAAYADPIVRGLVETQLSLVEAAGRSNSLSAKLVQLTIPGVPDVYQGTELWDLSLVDPDNRRPVDFDLRSEALRTQDAGELPSIDDEGAVKLLVVSAALRLLRARPELFTGYRPLPGRGVASHHVVAFDRGGAITVATRLPITLAHHGGWDDTTLDLPDTRSGYADALTGRVVAPGEVRVAALLDRYPVALLQRIDDES
ncbi:malto-oligosyltrehalose synthase [Herbiconiux moechotypicola]|uniref:Malto-oligosyltrehalose synthase n=1 Tax=Herbiconiux moechotypicola TaxID=637393 RepID=A0ABP5QDL0_9MICO|nr:malto-oligosyltrehalose synthase [Herbiconiux moechotypicola]MCS5729789.1 malto-oligosyltrehalose synthase [Herbiconiux moechotypicola]